MTGSEDQEQHRGDERRHASVLDQATVIDAERLLESRNDSVEAEARVELELALPIEEAGYALRSPALSQAREAALAATAVMTVEGSDGVADAAHVPAGRVSAVPRTPETTLGSVSYCGSEQPRSAFTISPAFAILVSIVLAVPAAWR